MMFVVVWCLALWLDCLCLVLCGPSCWWHLLLVVLCGHQCIASSHASCTPSMSQPRTVRLTVWSLGRFSLLLLWTHCSYSSVFLEVIRETWCPLTILLISSAEWAVRCRLRKAVLPQVYFQAILVWKKFEGRKV